MGPMGKISIFSFGLHERHSILSVLLVSTVYDRKRTGTERMSLGFDYDFDTLTNGEKDELVQAFMALFNPTPTPPIVPLLANAIPILQLIVCSFTRMLEFVLIDPWLAAVARQPHHRAKVAARSKAVIQRVGEKLVQDRRAALAAATGSDGVEKSTLKGKDLLSVLSELLAN